MRKGIETISIYPSFFLSLVFGILVDFVRLGCMNFRSTFTTRRYAELVKSLKKQSTTIATGIAVSTDLKSSFATTQALWRFLCNDKVTLRKLMTPLRHFALQQVTESQSDYVLAVTDWSKLDDKISTNSTLGKIMENRKKHG